MQPTNAPRSCLRACMVGMGMIFDETYRPMFESLHAHGLFRKDFGYVNVALASVATRTGARARAYKRARGQPDCATSPASTDRTVCSVPSTLALTSSASHLPTTGISSAAKQAIDAGRHVLIEKPVGARTRPARRAGCARAAEAGPRESRVPQALRPRSQEAADARRGPGAAPCEQRLLHAARAAEYFAGQFAEWIAGRNPGTYVAVHYIKLIDFTFGGRLKTISCTGQRGIVGPGDGNTWDSTQLRLIYEYPDGREAAFDIHTSWVNPENFPGYVEQEVQFRFDNGVWNGHSRKRGIELIDRGPDADGSEVDAEYALQRRVPGAVGRPDATRVRRRGPAAVRRGSRVCRIRRRCRSPARPRWKKCVRFAITIWRPIAQVVAAVQAMEAILSHAADGSPGRRRAHCA